MKDIDVKFETIENEFPTMTHAAFNNFIWIHFTREGYYPILINFNALWKAGLVE